MVSQTMEGMTNTLLLFDNFIDKKRLCNVLGISLSFLNELMSRQGLPHFKIGRAVRFRLPDVMAWLERKGRRP